jgi:hypothetical protein
MGLERADGVQLSFTLAFVQLEACTERDRMTVSGKSLQSG